MNKLGVLRCLDREQVPLNARLASGELLEDELGQLRFMKLLSNSGVYQKVLEMILKEQQAS